MVQSEKIRDDGWHGQDFIYRLGKKRLETVAAAVAASPAPRVENPNQLQNKIQQDIKVKAKFLNFHVQLEYFVPNKRCPLSETAESDQRSSSAGEDPEWEERPSLADE